MKTTLALVAVSAAVAGTQLAFASGEGNSTSEASQAASTPSESVCNRSSDHKVLHSKLARKRWRERAPLRGTNLCLPQSHIRKHKQSLELYREYRRIAPYRCHSGSEGFYAIPCYVVSCESHFSWSAYNGSGAAGVYQLMPEWGRPFPVRSFRDKLVHHRLAAGLSLSNWVCA